MTRPTVQDRILATLRAGEIEDRVLYARLTPTPPRTVERALLALRNVGRVLTRNTGTMLRLPS